jgi:hypothetical protein
VTETTTTTEKPADDGPEYVRNGNGDVIGVFHEVDHPDHPDLRLMVPLVHAPEGHTGTNDAPPPGAIDLLTNRVAEMERRKAERELRARIAELEAEEAAGAGGASSGVPPAQGEE